MSRSLTVTVALLLFTCACSFAVPIHAEDAPKPKSIEHHVHSGYFEKNDSGLNSETTSIIACLDQEAFDKVFHPAPVMFKKNDFLAKDAFKTKFVVAVVKRGDAVWNYTVDSVTAENGVLTVKYKGAPQPNTGTAKFASPLIIALDKADYKSIIYVENGTEIGKAKLDK